MGTRTPGHDEVESSASIPHRTPARAVANRVTRLHIHGGTKNNRRNLSPSAKPGLHYQAPNDEEPMTNPSVSTLTKTGAAAITSGAQGGGGNPKIEVQLGSSRVPGPKIEVQLGSAGQPVRKSRFNWASEPHGVCPGCHPRPSQRSAAKGKGAQVSTPPRSAKISTCSFVENDTGSGPGFPSPRCSAFARPGMTSPPKRAF